MLSPTLIQRARTVDLLALAEQRTTLKRVSRTQGGEYAGPCPLCGGRDRFRVQPQRGRWLCRYCQPRWEDAITFLMRLNHLGFAEAVRALTGEMFPVAPSVRFVASPPLDTAPSPEWQTRARRLMQEAEHILWQSRGASARAWLHQRGLNEHILRQWHIGLIPRTQRYPAEAFGLSDDDVYVPAGVLIPSVFDDAVWYLKVRRLHPHADPKYLLVRGSHPTLYLQTTLDVTTTVCLCEGEFDALLLWQTLQAAGLTHIGVCTPGSQAPYPRAAWLTALTGKTLLNLFDQDVAGEQGADKWRAVRPDQQRITFPAKDLSEFWRNGGDLLTLLPTCLTR